MKDAPRAEGSSVRAAAPRTRRPWLWLAAGLPAGWVLAQAAAAFPALSQVYGRRLFPAISKTLRNAAELFPFSVAELLLAMFVLLAALLILRGIVRVLRGSAKLPAVLAAGLRRAAATAGVGYMAFLLAWGLNYARPALAEKLELEPRPSSPAELTALCQELASQSALARRAAVASAQGPFVLGQHPLGATTVGTALRELATRHPGLAELSGPDPLLRFPRLSPILSRLGLAGIWSPFTAEAHVNGDLPDVLIPFTACHEAAHGRGITREDEASFVAYLAGRRSDDARLRYSANFCAWRTAIGQLARVDRDAARGLLETADEGLRSDAQAVRDYWSRVRSWMTDVAHHTNDLYLRSQGEKRGVESYGALVDLLLAERRRRGSEL